MKKILRQVLELTNKGNLRYSLIELKLNDSKNHVIFTTSQKVSNEITSDTILDDEVKTNITEFMNKISNMLNIMKRMKKIEERMILNIILPTEITTLKLDTYNCDHLTSFNSHTLNEFLKTKKRNIDNSIQIMSENKALIVNDKRYSFNEAEDVEQRTNAAIEVLNCYAKEDFAEFMTKLTKEKIGGQIFVMSRSYAIKKELQLTLNSEDCEQTKLIFDWKDSHTWIDIIDGSDKKRIKINIGLNQIIEEINKILVLNGKLNTRLISSCYLPVINLGVKKPKLSWFRAKNKFNDIVELTNYDLKLATIKAINEIMQQICLSLKQDYNIVDIDDSQKYHFGELTKIKGIKDYYKTIALDRGYNQYIIANDYQNKFDGIYNNDYHLAFALIENEKARYQRTYEHVKHNNDLQTYMTYENQHNSRASYLNKAPEYVKKEKLIK